MDTIYKVLMQSALTSPIAINTMVFLLVTTLIIVFVIPHAIAGIRARQKGEGNPTVAKTWIYVTLT